MKRSGPLKRRTPLRSRRKPCTDARLELASRGLDVALGRLERTLDDAAPVLAALDPRPAKAPPTVEVREVAASAQLHAVPPSPRAVRSRAYLEHVKARPCCCCGRRRPDVVVDPAHFGKRGVGQKADDLSTAPGCRECHEFQERNGYLPLEGASTITLVRARSVDERAQVAELRRRTRLVYAEAALASIVDWHRRQRAA